nr:MAG TPA: hypothetical protein [Bacteriophage sp.]
MFISEILSFFLILSEVYVFLINSLNDFIRGSFSTF